MKVKDISEILFNAEVVIFKDGKHYATIPDGSNGLNDIFPYAEVKQITVTTTKHGMATRPLLQIDI